MRNLTSEEIARIREEWQEEIRHETPKQKGSARPPTFVPSMLDGLTGLTVEKQMAKLGCSKRTIDKIRAQHPFYIARKQVT